MTLEWNSEYSVGVHLIDDQHKRFMDIFMRVENAINEATIEERFSFFLEEVEKHALDHFQTEEQYFDIFQYPFSEEHKGEHKKILEKIRSFRVRWVDEGSNIALVTDFFELLEDWLVQHIMVHDKKYMQCFHENGLS